MFTFLNLIKKLVKLKISGARTELFFKKIDEVVNSTKIERIRVPANDILHIRNRDTRTGAIRGLTSLLPIIKPLKNKEDYEDAEVNAAKNNALFFFLVPILKFFPKE